MLNIGRLAVGGGEYYLEVVASGLEDYYLGAGEAPGYWTGTASPQLGLAGQVTATSLQAVLAGTHPVTGEALRRGNGKPRLPGFDLTFRAPKSVSLLWALTEPGISEDVRAAHDAAVAAAIGYLERHAARTRRGAQGRQRVDADGVVAAAFRHRTSRAGDPLLHTHILVANLAHTPDDDRWRTLDSRSLYRHSKTAGYVYQAVLRHELTTSLGVQWHEVERGTADLTGIPREAIEHFSRRRSDILAHLAITGETSAKAAQIATLATRQRKDPDVDHRTLHDRWRARADAIGLDTHAVQQLLWQTIDLQPHRVDQDAVLAEIAGPDGLTAQQSTFTRRDVVRAWCDRLRDGAPLDVLEELADGTIAPEAGVAVPLTAPSTNSPSDPRIDQVLDALQARAAIRTDVCPPLRDAVTVVLTHPAVMPERLVDELLADRLGDAHDPLAVLTWRTRQIADNLSLTTPPTTPARPAAPRRREDEPLFSTSELLLTEQQALDQAADARASITVDPHLVAAALQADDRLSDEQQAMVHHLTTSSRGVQVVVGRAGAGKTTALAAAVPLWKAAGCTVIGAALAARTAQQLGDEAHIPAMTIDRLLTGLDQRPARHSDVIVIDEAAMVGTRTLARLIDHTTSTDARLVLVGDHHQLPEIAAGGLFAALAHWLPHVELTTNRRQHDPAERAAVDLLRDGHPDAITHFTHPDRYTTHPTHDDAITAVVGAWWSDRTANRSTLMLAATQSDVDALNREARGHLNASRLLHGPALQTSRGEFQVGDEILCLVNDRRIGVLNGTTARIDAIAGDHLLVTTSHGHEVLLPSSYWRDGGITHAYATTVHKAQGRTIDSTHLLLTDDAYREIAYVMLSRHRHHLTIHTTGQLTCRDLDTEHHAALDAPPTPSDPLSTAMHRAKQQHLARESLYVP